jgi:hypothetical protein
VERAAIVRLRCARRPTRYAPPTNAGAVREHRCGPTTRAETITTTRAETITTTIAEKITGPNDHLAIVGPA